MGLISKYILSSTNLVPWIFLSELYIKHGGLSIIPCQSQKFWLEHGNSVSLLQQISVNWIQWMFQTSNLFLKMPSESKKWESIVWWGLRTWEWWEKFASAVGIDPALGRSGDKCLSHYPTEDARPAAEKRSQLQYVYWDLQNGSILLSSFLTVFRSSILCAWTTENFQKM